MTTRFEDLYINGTCYTSNWFRSYGKTGWYSETYGGGIFMEDTTWVRTYGSKSFYCNQEIRAQVRMRVGGGENRIEPTAWDKIILCANGSNTSGGYFYYNSNNSYGTISDRRTKNSIETLPKEDAINFVMNLKPVIFKMNGVDKFSCGFIAQEVLGAAQNEAQKNITPNHESYDESNPDSPLMGVSDHHITPNVVSIVQYLFNELIENQKKLDTIETRLKVLEDLLK